MVYNVMLKLAFLLSLVLVDLYVATGQSVNTPFICDVPTPSAGSPPLPSLPNRYTTQVEANIQNRGRTVLAVEYYDEPNDRGRLDFTYGRHGHSLIYTYADQQWFHMTATGCTAHPLTNSSRFLAFPTTFDDQGNAHIRGVADVLRFGKKYNETYMGRAEVRGVEADYWKTCMPTRAGGTMSVEWYFSAVNNVTRPTTRRHLDRSRLEGRPLRLVIEGIDPHRFRHENANFRHENASFRHENPSFRHGNASFRHENASFLHENASVSHYFKHFYEFVAFTPGPIDDSIFQIPHGMFCDGSSVAKKLPLVPDRFSAEIQSVDLINKTIAYLQEVYDEKSQRFAISGSQFTSVDDARIGVGFFLHQGNCVTYELAPSLLKKFQVHRFFDLSTDKKHLGLKPVKELFGLSDKNNVTYVGVRTVNDISCDVFVEEVPDYRHPGNTSIIEMSFARKSLRYLASNHSEYQIPVKYEMYSKSLVGQLLRPSLPSEIHQVFDVYKFDVSAGQYQNVDLGKCYTSSMVVWFQLNEDYESAVKENLWLFGNACAQAVAKNARVDVSRVAKVMPMKLGSNIMVQLTLLGSLNNVTVRPYISLGDSLVHAIANLQQSIDSAQFTISLDEKQFSAVKGSFSTTSPSTNANLGSSSESDSFVHVGILVGVSIGMFLIGLAVGCCIFYLVAKKRGAFDTSYDKHANPI